MTAQQLLEIQIATLQSSIAIRRSDIKFFVELAAASGKTTNKTLRRLHKQQYAERKLMKRLQTEHTFWFGENSVNLKED